MRVEKRRSLLHNGMLGKRNELFGQGLDFQLQGPFSWCL